MIKKKFVLILLLCVFIIPNKSISQDSQSEENFDLELTKKTLTKEINKLLKETGIPSISISLIKDDTIVWADAFGYANVKKQVPATSATIYHTGSNFKFVTATAIMQLAEAGKLDLDDPVNKYLDESAIADLSNEGTPVTIRHLLSHHSGLKGPIEFIPIWKRMLPRTLEEVASEISAEELPGINFKYCNHCFALLGLVIEKVSGQSYQDYIVENILKPLRIQSEGPLVPTPGMIEELALPYTIVNNQPFPEYQIRFDVFPAGDMYLTVPEIANFLIAQLNGGLFQGQSILSSESIAEMQKAQFGSYYGLGTGVINIDDEKFLLHTGALPGFSTAFKVGTSSKTGVYIASNSGGVHDALVSIGDLSLKLLSGEKNAGPLPSFVKMEFEEINLPVKVLEKYTGKYEIRSELIFAISLEDKQLYAQLTGQPKLELFPYEEDRFFYKTASAQIGFNFEKGKVTSLTLYQKHREIEAKKIE